MIERYRDMDRPQLLAEIEITNRDCVGLILPQVFNSELSVSNQGTSKHLVYEDQVEQVAAMVETEPDKVEQATQIYRGKLLKLLEKDELIARGTTWDKVDWAKEEIRTFMSGNTLSVHAVFNDLFGRDMKPLTAFKILRVGIVPELKSDPLAQFRKKESGVDADTLAQAMLIYDQLRAQRQQSAQAAQPQNGRK